MKDVLLSPIQKDALIREILSGVRGIIEENRTKEITSKEYLTIKDVSELFKVSGVTIHDWSKKGILKKYKVRGRVRFRKDEVLSALKVVESKKGGRV